MKNTEKKIDNIIITDARVLPGGFRNFAGEAGKFNNAGDRFFNVQIPEERADELRKDGWNVKMLAAREEGKPETYILKVKVRFNDKYPQFNPLVYLHSPSGVTQQLDADSIDILDRLRFSKVDLAIRPYQWEMGNKRGVTAQLKTMHATFAVEDEFEDDYREVNYINSDKDGDLPF